MKTLSSVLFALAILFPILTGCSAKGGPDRVTISYQTMETLPQQRAALAKLVEAFEAAHPSVRVKIQVSPSGFQKLQAQMAAGDMPDVFYYVSDRLPVLMHRHAVLNLQPFLDEDRSVDLSAYFPKTVQACQTGGALYCFPFHFSTDVLFYNKDLFDKAGLAHPQGDWTWDDFAKAAKALTTKTNGQAQQYGTLQPRPLLLVKSYGGDCFDGNNCVIDGPAGRKAIAFLDELMHWGAVPSMATLRDIEVMDGVSLFSTGRIGMLLGRTYMLAEFSKLKDLDWDIALVPKGERRYSRLAVGGNCIWSQTKHPKEAWEFVKFFSGPEGSAILGAFRNGVPALRSVAQSDIFLKPPPAHVQVFLEALDTSDIENPGMILWQEYVDKVIQPTVEAALLGDISTPEALRQMRNKGENILKEESKLRSN